MRRRTPAISAYSQAGVALEVGERLELLVARIDLRSRQSSESIYAELLTAKATHDGPVNHGTRKFFAIHVVIFQIEPASRERTHETTRKTIARACGIENLVEKVARHNEELVVAKEHRPIFAAFDHQRARTHFQYLASRAFQVGFAR